MVLQVMKRECPVKMMKRQSPVQVMKRGCPVKVMKRKSPLKVMKRESPVKEGAVAVGFWFGDARVMDGGLFFGKVRGPTMCGGC